MKRTTTLLALLAFAISCGASVEPKGSIYDQIVSEALQSASDDKGNIIPDFSRVGYHFGDKEIPTAKVVVTLTPPSDGGDATALVQGAIDKVGALPLEQRGAILLTKGEYNISRPLRIAHSGIVLRGEGASEDPNSGTILRASNTTHKYDLINIGRRSEIVGSIPEKMNITDKYVPLGSFCVNVSNPKEFEVGDKVILMVNNNDKWIQDLKMDQIEARHNTIQWDADSYKIKARREITKIKGSTLWFENPTSQTIEEQYGGGAVYKYDYTDGIVSEGGVENLFIKSDYLHDEHEGHGWTAINFATSEHCWVRDVEGKHFGYALVHINGGGKNITVANCKHTEPKSITTGGRKYTFSTSGELNLFTDCIDEGGRHSFVSSPFNCGPNVFVACSATNTFADIGPHHRWNTATLYDNVITDGQMNAHDRGYYGTGHGWAGANNVFWNCEAGVADIDNTWNGVARNFSIGHIGRKEPNSGRSINRPDGVWISHGEHVSPRSLYHAQLEHRHSLQKSVYDVE